MTGWLQFIRPLVAAFVVIAGSGLADLPAAGQPVPAGRVLYDGVLEKQFSDIESEVPGFAGWYFANDGNAVVRVKHEHQREAAMERVGRILDARAQAGRGRSAARKGRPAISARPALYSFLELAAFRDAITRDLPTGVNRIDVDEEDNVLSLGVEDESYIAGARAGAARAGIPGNALRIDVVGKIRSRASLSDTHRPLRGGMAFGFSNLTYGVYWGECSIGVNGYLGGIPGFITASHCTGRTWSYDGAAAYQMALDENVGYEWEDPPPFPGTYPGVCANGLPGKHCCPSNPSGTSCRYSDTAFYAYNYPSAEFHGGATIARTDRTQSPSTTVIGSMPVLGTFYAPATGEWLDKIGKTTGWTTGQVRDTCVRRAHQSAGPNGGLVILLCQQTTNIEVAAGDSGAPVFKWFGNEHVEWAGIIWGEDSQDTYHSPAEGVEMDIPAFSQW
jgi:hypothetical protein